MQYSLTKTLISSVLLGSPEIKLLSATRLGSQRKLSPAPVDSYAVVANRAKGTISFIKEGDTPGSSGTAVPDTQVIEVGNRGSEPMYVNANMHNIYVGDRHRGCVTVFDPNDINRPSDIRLKQKDCDGVFHQWLNDEYLVVVCDISQSIAVIDVDDHDVEYIDLKDELNPDCKLHDITINKNNEIFTTSLGAGCQNQIIKIDAEDGSISTKINIGGTGVDPHVAVYAEDEIYLYSPQQKRDGGKLVVYMQDNLEEVRILDVDNAHGICFSSDGSKLYVTDINPGRRLVQIRPEGQNGNSPARIVDESESGAFVAVGVAHNCAVTERGNIFVTHSGSPAEAVTFFGDKLESEGYYSSDGPASNPFGIGVFHGVIDFED